MILPFVGIEPLYLKYFILVLDPSSVQFYSKGGANTE